MKMNSDQYRYMLSSGPCIFDFAINRKFVIPAGFQDKERIDFSFMENTDIPGRKTPPDLCYLPENTISVVELTSGFWKIVCKLPDI